MGKAKGKRSTEVWESRSLLRGIFNHSPDAIVSIDERRRIVLFNRGAERIFGYSKREVIGRPVEILMPDRFRTVHRAHVAEFAKSGRKARPVGKRGGIVGRRKNGEEFPVEASLLKCKSGGGQVFTVILRDITKRKEVEEALADRAIRDTLTGLYNRRHFSQRVQEEIARANRTSHPFALLLCGLDRFKAINDASGHHFGDKLLKKVARVLLDATRGVDLVFRWGGDQFVVLFSKASRSGILTAANRIRSGVSHLAQESRVDLGMSVGVALYPEHGLNEEGLMRLADRALYIAKRSGRGIHVGEEEYRLDEQSVKIVFQPIVDVWSNQVIGYEALSRDPKGKLTVTELFNKYKAVGQLSELKKICFVSQLKASLGIGIQRLFVNVDFDVLSQSRPLPKPPGKEVILEISELEALHDIKNHLSIAKMWRRAGYKFAIDDFGAGFISLPFIARLFPEYIKLDRSTMTQAVSSPQFRKFLRPLLTALRSYATQGIIAEGVEREKELEVMREMGIFIIQGFLVGRPREMN